MHYESALGWPRCFSVLKYVGVQHNPQVVPVTPSTHPAHLLYTMYVQL